VIPNSGTLQYGHVAGSETRVYSSFPVVAAAAAAADTASFEPGSSPWFSGGWGSGLLI
jgi:hypothetical protein